MTQYFLGQGKVYLAARDSSGKPTALRWLGDVSAAKISLKVNKVNHKESYSGQKATAKAIVVGKEGSVDLTMMEISKENLALALDGKASTIEAGSITGEVLPLGLVAGDRIALKYMKVSNVELTDSSAVPVKLDASKYELDANYGAITLRDISALTQPLNVAYKHDALDSVAVFNAQAADVFLRYEGINLAEGGVPVVVELYKVNTDPLKDLALITDKIADMNINAAILIDTSKPLDGELGQFGRIIQLRAE